MSLSEWKDALDDLAVGEHPIAASNANAMKTSAISLALRKHSQNAPQMVVEDVAGTGAFDYPLSGLASWEDGFSQVRQVEYPVDDDDETPDMLEETDWIIYAKPSGKQLRFVSNTPAVGESARVTYTARHTIDADSCSVEAADVEAVQALAASFYCRRLSAAYAQASDPSIQADSVDHLSKRAEYAALSTQYRKEYDDHMGTKDGKPKPACVVQDQDVDYPGGYDRLTHPRRRR